MALSPGNRLGPYEILAPLGAGGMGEVYRARDAKLGRDIALKILPAELAGDPERLKRFEQEAHAASSLNHPAIVHVYDVDAADSLHYIAMELVEGRSLRDLLASGPLPTRKLLDIAIEVADGLAKAHAAGIVHRDLKPENLLVTEEGHVKILDFGLAKLADAGGGDPAERSTSPRVESRTGQILGTVGYMSPEQASGAPVDFRSDQFAIGAVLYEMASGRRAFHGKSAPETLAAILRDQPEPLSRTHPGVLPPMLGRVVEERCLAKDPRERYASTWDLLRDLHTVRDHLSDLSGVALAPATPRRRATGVLAAVLGTILALATGYLAGKGAARVPPQPKFNQITFGRGSIWSALFAPDGETVVYGAAWDGRPVEPFLTRLGGPESRALGLPGAEILAVSSSGELAISLERRYVGGWQFSGTLARVALAGGSPRPVLEDVQYADWSPDGRDLAIVREEGGKTRLEYPIGTVLYETAGWISHPRVSPGGDRVAFLDHPAQGDDRGTVAVVDRSGQRKTLTGEWASEQGLAWSASGGEVWFTAIRSGNARALHAVTLAGVERTVAVVPGRLTLHDVSREGRVLLARDPVRIGIRGLLPGSDLERDVSALDSSLVRDLSADGRTLLIHEQGEGAPADYAIYLRRTDTNSPPVLLGEGSPLSLSPDGRWVLALLASQRGQLLLVPTGAGQVRRLKETGLEYQTWGSFLPDGKRIVCLANEPGRAARLYVQDLEGGRPRALSPEGVSLTSGTQPVSPDGALVAAIGPDRRPTLYPVDGGAPRAIAGAEPGEVPTRFTSDGRSLFVFRRGELPGRVFTIDFATSRRSLWREIVPSDPAGLAVGINRVLPTPDGRFYVYNASRFLSELYVAEGLR